MTTPKVCEAPDCDVKFDADRSTQRYHSNTCRQRAGRARKAAEAAARPGPKDPDTGSAEHGLVTAVRKELAAADALDTVDGQIAMQLARKLTEPNNVSSGLAKELRATIAAAKGDAPAPPPSDDDNSSPAESEEEDDEVTKARKARERKAREAAAR